MSDQLDLLSMVRPTDPETSRAAALLTDRKGGMRKVMAFLSSRPGEAFTDHEIAEQTGMDKGSASKRRLDCQRDGLVEFAGTYGVTPTGAQARKWTATVRAISGVAS